MIDVNPMRIFVTVCALWVASEFILIVVKRSRSGEATRQDRGSFLLLWSVITISAIVASMFAGIRSTRMPVEIRPYALWTGLALIVAGVVIRLFAILTLRRYFTIDVAIARDHKVIDTGLYAIVRHPAYFGSFLSFIGLGLAFRNWLSLITIIIGPAIAFAYRILVEERALINALGDDRAYAARTKRFIPGVF